MLCLLLGYEKGNERNTQIIGSSKKEKTMDKWSHLFDEKYMLIYINRWSANKQKIKLREYYIKIIIDELERYATNSFFFIFSNDLSTH